MLPDNERDEDAEKYIRCVPWLAQVSDMTLRDSMQIMSLAVLNCSLSQFSELSCEILSRLLLNLRA